MNRLSLSKKSRKASVALELLLVLPIGLVISLAIVELSMILMVRQQLTAASREGARVASVGATDSEIKLAVRTYLGTGTLNQAEITTVLTDPGGNPIPSGGAVQVVVSLPTALAVPDMLAPFGFSIADDTVYARTIMRKE